VYESIKSQSFDEWVIIYNHGAKKIGFNDPRVKEISLDLDGGIGFYKKLCCQNCSGEILIECDHDDLLTSDAIEEVRKAFNDPEVGFVYSNAIITDMNFSKRERFSPLHGWKYRETEFQGHLLDEPLSFEATPASVSRIWYAPDHLRAFRRDVYDSVGGYDVNLKILDDQDLMCRLYQVTEFHHIDNALYIYRVHGENAWLRYNQEIQNGVYPLYDKYIEGMALKWAKDKGLACYDLGGRLNSAVGYKTVDLKDADVIADLNGRWPFEDSSVGVIRAYDVFEHLKDSIHTMKELYRVLAPGGCAFIQVPSTDGRGAFQDPTHISFFNENSFLYYTNQRLAQYIDSPVRFQAMRLYTTEMNSEKVCWVVAHLISLKNGFVPPGVIEI